CQNLKSYWLCATGLATLLTQLAHARAISLGMYIRLLFFPLSIVQHGTFRLSYACHYSDFSLYASWELLTASHTVPVGIIKQYSDMLPRLDKCLVGCSSFK